MHWKQWLKQRWLYAMDVPEMWVVMGIWNNPDAFEHVPDHCCICGRAWRPDRPHYVAMYSPDKDDLFNYYCREHGDVMKVMQDCFTGDVVEFSLPPTPLQRAWRDVRYWTRTTWRFVWGLVRYGTHCVTHPVRWWKWRKIQRALKKGTLP
ncbi:MAG TPA: hypothetical protein VM537_10770 [Anaerolineae bacterium]|nr:hypothetical protein [Anaerolineae bacterium]